MQIDVKVTIYNILNFFMTCNIKKVDIQLKCQYARKQHLNLITERNRLDTNKSQTKPTKSPTK